MVSYLSFIFLDVAIWKTPRSGGRRISGIRKLAMFKHYAEFFSIRLHKTVDLDPSKNYVFAYHPHGIIGIGTFAAFLTEACGFEKLFPNICIYVQALNFVTLIPFSREFLMGCGVCDVSRQSCDYNLSRGPGHSIVLVPGGAREALDAHPGDLTTLTLATRMGFVKVALENGASLVPVFSFGENDVYKQVPNPKGSRTRSLQDRMQQWFGFSMPAFFGRGIFNYSFGFIPFRVPVNVVVGTPLDLPKLAHPSKEEISKWHGLYVQSLQRLFEDNKGKYIANKVEAKLVIA